MSYVILRLPRVLEKTGLSRSTLYEQMANDMFPRPVSLGARAVGWISSEVDVWLEARIGSDRKAWTPPQTSSRPRSEAA
jgi:prophage regulatory protein